MRILQVIPSLGFGGAERLVLELSKHLTKEGHEVQIVILHDEIGYANLAEQQEVMVIPSRVFYSLFGEDVIEVDNFNQFLDVFKPDIIHSHLLEAELVSRHKIKEGVTYITHWHGCNPIADKIEVKDILNINRWRNWKQRRILEEKYINCHNQFICISDFIADYLKDSFTKIPIKQYHTIHNGIRKPLTETGLNTVSDKYLNLVVLGRLAPFKKQELLLDIMVKLLDRGHSFIRLNFIGDGTSRRFLEEQSTLMGIGSNVLFHGALENPFNLLHNCDIMVHSTMNEAFGMAIVEGMSCGLPVVSFRTGGIPEIVVDQETGVLVQPGNIEEFANAVEELIINEELRIEMGTKAKERAKQFTMEAFCQNTERLYFQLRTSTEQ